MIDIQSVFASVWQSTGWLVPFLLIAGGIRLGFKARAQGRLGEGAVKRAVKGWVYEAVHDVLIANGRGGLTQIDHLLLTSEGIAVIETKSFTGRIFGTTKEKCWTQRFGRKSFRIGNPLRQNYGHVQAVKKLVGDDVPVFGHVVIVGTAEYPKGKPEGVLSKRQLKRLLKSMHSGVGRRADWDTAWERLIEAAESDPAARKAHRAQLERRFGRDFRPAVGMGMIALGMVLAGWFFLT